MSSQNEFPGPSAGRPARILNQDQQRQSAWPNGLPNGLPNALAPTSAMPAPSQQPAGWQQQPAPAPSYGAQRPSSAYGQWNPPQQASPYPSAAMHTPQHASLAPAPGGYVPPSASGAPIDPYAPQFEPYAAPQRPMQNLAQSVGQAGQAPNFGFSQALQLQPHPQAPQWPHRPPVQRAQDPAGNFPPPQRPLHATPMHPAPMQVGPTLGGPMQTAALQAAPLHAAPQPIPGALEPAFAEPRYQAGDLDHPDWGQEPSLGMAHDPYQQPEAGTEFGFAQPEGGELEQVYADDDADYEIEEAPRGRRPMMIAAALVGAILVGGGMAYSYKKIALASGGSQGDPPIIKSEEFASKTKPADAGGKQFPYADSKIMSRLGDGTSPAAAVTDSSSAQAASNDTSSSVDENGTRKVSTLVVGRDGTIQAPAAAPMAQPAAAVSAPVSEVSVPGTQLVDVFGAARAQNSTSSAPSAAQAPERVASADASDTAAPTKKRVTPVTISKINSAAAAKAAPTTTGSVDNSDDAPATPAPAKKKLKKVARADTATATDASPDAAPVTSSGGGSGFVAVLASVPKSASSRMDALKRFADMQQKYATALAGKTPDVADAHLGSKGEYHRLIVGPPGSREQASAICSQLKTAGYTGCWVTAY